MRKLQLSLLMLPLVAGCLSSAPEAPTHWTIDFSRDRLQDVREKHGADTVRIASVDVRAPFAGQRLAVLRPDGSIAFDAFNTFASTPAQLVKGALQDAAEASGRFAHVFASGSTAQATHTMEVVVTQLALDCRCEGKRTARVALTVTLLRGREAVAVVRGVGAEEAGADYSSAFSTAFVQAMRDALGQLPTK